MVRYFVVRISPKKHENYDFENQLIRAQIGTKSDDNANIQFTPFIHFSLHFFFLFSRIIVLFAYFILHGLFIPFCVFSYNHQPSSYNHPPSSYNHPPSSYNHPANSSVSSHVLIPSNLSVLSSTNIIS
jgi:hypothetical protein